MTINALNNTVINNDFSVNRSAAGTAVISSANHSDNSNTDSNALLEAIVGGASGGDPYLHLKVTGGSEFSFGIDNTDSDTLKLTDGATPSTGNERITINSSGDVNIREKLRVRNETPANDYDITMETTNIGGSAGMSMSNFDNSNTSSHCLYGCQTDPSGGDPYSTWNIIGTVNWTAGIDNSDSDKFKIGLRSGAGDSSPSGITSYMTFTTAGEVTMPLQPAFAAYLGGVDSNVTGDGTTFTIGSGTALTEIFDQNSDFNTNGTFTAPVTGIVTFQANIWLQNPVGNTATITLVSSNGSWTGIVSDPVAIQEGTSNIAGYNVSATIDMDASDTATITIINSGGAKTTDVFGSAARRTYFTGFLAC